MAGAQSGVARVHRVKLWLVAQPVALTAEPAVRQTRTVARQGKGQGLWLPEENGRALPIERERDAGRRRRIGGGWGRNATQ